jgi:hypothetical protein
MTKSIDALKTIARYVEAKKPKTLAEAEHMLDLISVIADETEDVAGSSRRPAAYAIDANSIASFHADSLAIAGPPSENLKFKTQDTRINTGFYSSYAQQLAHLVFK